MSNCIALNDKIVHDLLINLTKPEILKFERVLAQSLIDFSMSDERKYQPNPGVILRPDGQRSLFRNFTSAAAVGTKIVVHPAPKTDAGQNPLHGVLILCDANGLPTALMNAEEITGYRTSLCAMIPYMWRHQTEDVVVFGAGMQALWHIRLALALRGSEIKTITLVNRSQDRAQSLISKVEEENRQHWKSQAKLGYVGPSQPDYEKHLEALLSAADIIFCAVPSQQPLFPARYVLNRTKDKKGPYISAIGSWQPDMIELDPDILKHAADRSRGYHPHGSEDGFIVVDDRQSALEHAGEVLQSKLRTEQMVEVGEILSLQQDSEQQQKAPHSQWLKEEFVVYKSVGVSLTDLVAGNAILSLAKEKNLGAPVNI